MSIHAASGVPLAGPSDERRAFLKKTALWSCGGVLVAAIVAVFSTTLLAPAIYGAAGGWGGLIAILGSFAIAHYVARGMVYGGAKVPGLILAVVMEGFSLGFLLLQTILTFGVGGGLALVERCMFLVALTGGGMLAYVWFNKSELSMVKGALTMLSLPMLVAMALSWAFPIGGVLGIAIAAVFVAVSCFALLRKLNVVVHEMDETMHVEAAYELSMSVLVLFWNLLNLLNRLGRR
jgi:FtsH-binding integral membrane protein